MIESQSEDFGVFAPVFAPVGRDFLASSAAERLEENKAIA